MGGSVVKKRPGRPARSFRFPPIPIFGERAGRRRAYATPEWTSSLKWALHKGTHREGVRRAALPPPSVALRRRSIPPLSRYNFDLARWIDAIILSVNSPTASLSLIPYS